MNSYSTNNIKHHRNIALLMVICPLLVFLLVTSVLFASNTFINRTEAAIVLSNNFENGLGWPTQRVSADRLRLASTTDNGKPAPQGSNFARFELRQGDNPLAQWCCAGTNRVEFTTSTNEQKGQERWYSWHQMFDSNYPSYDTYPTSQRQGWQIFAQWHGNDEVSPPLAWWAAGSNVVLASGNGNSYIEQWRGSMNKGSWNNIKMRIIWGDSGRIVLWYNGVKVMDKTGIDNVTNPPLYFKTGMYRPQSLSATAITYIDDFRMAATEAGLGLAANPAPAQPPPIPAPTPAPLPSPPPVSSPNPTLLPSPIPPSNTPVVKVPGANPSQAVAIPEDIDVEEDGSIVADFTGDGVNEQAVDQNRDGSIDPAYEIISTRTLDETVYGFEKPLNKEGDSSSMLKIKPGPLREVYIPKPVAYTFIAAGGVTLTGIGLYLAYIKLALFAGLRGRL